MADALRRRPLEKPLSGRASERKRICTWLVLAFVTCIWIRNELRVNPSGHQPPNQTEETKRTRAGRHRRSIKDAVLLQGQFNYPDIPSSDILGWVDAWSEYFDNLVVVGPFTNETMAELQSFFKNRTDTRSLAGFSGSLEVRYGAKGPRDAGSPSCYANLMRTMEEVPSHPVWKNLEGILYLHDDVLLNLTSFFNTAENQQVTTSTGNMEHQPIDSLSGEASPRLDAIIQTWPYDSSFRDAQKEMERSYWIQKTAPKYIVYKNHANTTFPSSKALFRSFPKSRWNHECSSALPKIARDPRIDDYLTNNERGDPVLQFPGSRLSDVLYVPRAYFQDFIKAADILAKHEFFLECAFPAILQMMKVAIEKRTQHSSEDPVRPSGESDSFLKREVSICTQYGGYRGRPSMIRHCWEAGRLETKRQSIYHPIKLSMVGGSIYSQLLSWVQETNETSIAAFNWSSMPSE